MCGRTADQKRRFALAVIEELERTFGVPRAAVYVIFTEHDGPDFQMHDGVLPSWSAGEDPLHRRARDPESFGDLIVRGPDRSGKHDPRGNANACAVLRRRGHASKRARSSSVRSRSTCTRGGVS